MANSDGMFVFKGVYFYLDSFGKRIKDMIGKVKGIDVDFDFTSSVNASEDVLRLYSLNTSSKGSKYVPFTTEINETGSIAANIADLIVKIFERNGIIVKVTRNTTQGKYCTFTINFLNFANNDKNLSTEDFVTEGNDLSEEVDGAEVADVINVPNNIKDFIEATKKISGYSEFVMPDGTVRAFRAGVTDVKKDDGRYILKVGFEYRKANNLPRILNFKSISKMKKMKLNDVAKKTFADSFNSAKANLFKKLEARFMKSVNGVVFAPSNDEVTIKW